jgi:hypothetical protein
MATSTAARAATNFPVFKPVGAGVQCSAYGQLEVTANPSASDVFEMCRIPKGTCGGQGADEIAAFGQTSSRLRASEVTGAHVIAKLRGNPHFAEVVADAAPVAAIETAAQQAPALQLRSRKRKPRQAGNRAAGGAP